MLFRYINGHKYSMKLISLTNHNGNEIEVLVLTFVTNFFLNLVSYPGFNFLVYKTEG